jgi:hypothetical protein
MMFFLLAPLAPFDIEMASASPSGKFGLTGSSFGESLNHLAH